jgi:NAD(P)-dependent dehydrogenase (short-subunit alcohol dehydrogenase family)
VTPPDADPRENLSGLFDLTGKRALVTGGAHGLGRMIAEGLLVAGAEVTITSRKPEGAVQAAEELSLLGRCLPLAIDLEHPEAIERMVLDYRARSDGLDILINNAGKTWGAPLETFPDSAWPRIMAMNVQSPFKLIQSFLPDLAASGAARDPARVINIGSIAGVRTDPVDAYSYVASKAALHQLSRQLAADVASRNITVNAVLPGFFPTSMTSHMRGEDGELASQWLDGIPLRRLGRQSDIVGIVQFLASRAGAYVTGALIPVDGGLVGCR